MKHFMNKPMNSPKAVSKYQGKTFYLFPLLNFQFLLIPFLIIFKISFLTSLEFSIEKLTEMSETLDKNLQAKITALKQEYESDIAILQELLGKK